jgi:dolichol-phosphate mannosyltransferase
MDVVVVIPAYNERAYIEQTVLDWLRVLDTLDGRLIAVDDGSKDSTGVILDRLAEKEPRLLVHHQQNAGHGAAILAGYRMAITLNPDYIFQADSDDQIKPSEFWRLWERREQSPFVLGVRQDRNDAAHRLVVTNILKGLNLLIFGTYIRDANAPFRLMSTTFVQAALRQFPRDVFAPNIFLSLVAAKLPIAILEVPVQHFRRSTGTESLNMSKLIRVCLRCAKELMQFRLGFFHADCAQEERLHVDCAQKNKSPRVGY